MTTENPAEKFAQLTQGDPRDASRPEEVRRVAGIFHGILTGDTDETWPEDAESWALLHDPTFRAVLSWYYGLPFPRLEALRNRRRFPALVRRLETKIEGAISYGIWPLIFLFGHSNGAVLVWMVMRELIRRGHVIEHVVFIAPAVRSAAITREFVQWMEEGKLRQATLIMATEDKTLSLVSRFKLLAWPWGSLGVDGWAEDDIPLALQSRFSTVQEEVGHSTLLSPAMRRETFERYLAPVLGFTGEESVA